MLENLLKIDYLKAVTGIVTSINAASCDIRLNSEGTKIGRLYINDSLAFNIGLPFDQLVEYQVGQKITAVPSRARVQENSRVVLYYLNERWIHKNPWQNLQLRESDLVFGYVSNAIPDFGCPLAYLVKLDHQHSQIKLPDIEVFLPIDAIPSIDGYPLPLKFGDLVKGRVTNATFRPPLNPHICIIQLRHVEKQYQLEALERSRTAFFVLGKNKTKHVKQPQLPLQGKHLVLIDDELSAIHSFKRGVQKLGAVASFVHWKSWFKDEDILKRLFPDNKELKKTTFDLVIIDDTLGKPTVGLYLLERLSKSCPGLRFTLTSSFYSPETISKLESKSRKKIAAIHKPIRLASLLEVFSDSIIPREFVKGIQPQLDIKELIKQAEKALQSVTGEDNVVNIMAFSLDDGDRLSGIGDSSHMLLSEEKARWINDPYFRVLLQNKTEALQVNRKENPALADIVLSKRAIKNFSQWYICKVESQRLLIGHCFNQRPNLPLELGKWMAEQLAHRLWEWHWREAISPTLALGQQAASIAHELVNYSDKANRELESLRNYFESDNLEEIPAHMNSLASYLQNSRDTYASLVGSMAREGRWSFRTAGEEVVNMLRPLCEKRDIRIELSLPEINIACPKAVLQMALHNLISNAVKHHFDADDIQGQPLVTVIALSDYTYIDIKIQDNGPGIPKHVEDKLFDFGDSFMQSENKKIEGQSHGIGLWLTQKLLSKFSGELFYTTARGIGTTFTLRLPLTIGAQ